MEFIDKNLSEEGESIIEAFLKRLQQSSVYPKDLYEVFKSDKDENGKFSKDKLIKVLLKEQNGLCCYCMRQLKQEGEVDEITLEHIILNSISNNEDFNRYLKRKTVLNDKVCLANDFIEEHKTKVPPYPHTIAYENLTASCNGKFFSDSRRSYCCNLKRGNAYIEPIVLYPTIHDEIEYKLNGYAIWKNDTKDFSLMNILGLNDPVLKMIRRIWIFVKKEKININQEHRDIIINRLMETFGKEDSKETDEIEMLFNFKRDPYWNLLLKYSYFGR